MVENFGDLALDENFDVYINSEGDLASVSGRDKFEQEVIVWLTRRASEIIGEVDDDNIVDLLETYAKRVAVEMDRIDSVYAFGASRSDEDINTYEVEIIYDSGDDDLVFEVP